MWPNAFNVGGGWADSQLLRQLFDKWSVGNCVPSNIWVTFGQLMPSLFDNFGLSVDAVIIIAASSSRVSP